MTTAPHLSYFSLCYRLPYLSIPDGGSDIWGSDGLGVSDAQHAVTNRFFYPSLKVKVRNSRYGNPVERISYIENGVKEERGKRREEKKIIMMTNPEEEGEWRKVL